MQFFAIWWRDFNEDHRVGRSEVQRALAPSRYAAFRDRSTRRRSSIFDRELCGSRAAESVPRKPAPSRISCFRASNPVAVFSRFFGRRRASLSVLVTSAFVFSHRGRGVGKPRSMWEGYDAADRILELPRESGSSSPVGISTISPDSKA